MEVTKTDVERIMSHEKKIDRITDTRRTLNIGLREAHYLVNNSTESELRERLMAFTNTVSLPCPHCKGTGRIEQ